MNNMVTSAVRVIASEDQNENNKHYKINLLNKLGYSTLLLQRNLSFIQYKQKKENDCIITRHYI